MRIATNQRFESGIDNLQQRQADLVRTQQQLTSGKRVERASDDPSAAARAERAMASAARSDASLRAIDASRNAMALTESALGNAAELLQQVRETIVAAGNASYSDAERAALADKLRGLRRSLFDIANTSDGAGGFVFSGQGSALPPFVDAPGGVQFAGVSGQQQAPSGEPLPLTADGRATWLSAPSGNGVIETRAVPGSTTAWIDAGRITDPSALTGSSYAIQFSVAAGVTTYSVLKDGLATPLTNVPYVEGAAIAFDGASVTVNGAPANGDGFEVVPSSATLSVFDGIDRAVARLAAPAQTRAQIAQGNLFALRDIDASMTRLGSVRASIGETLNRADSVADRTDAAKLAARTDRANAEDLDMVHGISEFASRQSGYDAALKAYSLVQRLSLFDYL